MSRFRHRQHHRPGCPEQVIYPTKCNTVHHCSESEVEHIHPSHTTVMNHHLVKNTHYYPHSTSYQNTVNSVNQYGGSYEVPNQGSVGGAMSPNMNQGSNYPTSGGMMNSNCDPGNQVGGVMQQGMYGKQCHPKYRR